MELHIITIVKAKCGKASTTKESKPPTRILLNLTYPEFLKEVVKVAEVKCSQLDCEHMCWRHHKPASASPINISEDESYGIMIQAI